MNQSIEPPISGLKILVVEDDMVSRMLLKSMLDENKIACVFARNGQEAIDIIKDDDSFDIILMDLRMPVLDGYQATKSIRQLGFDKPIIAQTAFVSHEDRNKTVEVGFTGFIAKPIRMLPLMNAIREALKL